MAHRYPTYVEVQQRNRKWVQDARSALLDALKSLNVSAVSIEYDGEGDSGQIQAIHATSGDGETINLVIPAPDYINAIWDEPPGRSLEVFIEHFAWQLLGVCHDGFENNEGGCGELTIDVSEGTILLEHNDRFIDVIQTVTEY